MTGYFTTRLVAVLNIVGLEYFGENRIKMDYLIHISQWNGIHLKKQKYNSLFKPVVYYSTFSWIKQDCDSLFLDNKTV